MSKKRIPLWVFRLQHRLSITHNELLAVTVAALLLIGGEVARNLFERAPAFDDEFYGKRDSLFFALSAAAAKADSALGVGETFVVADSGSVSPAVDTLAVADSRIDVNRASVFELIRLPGIGPRLAERIVDYRARHGPFRSPADLQRVSGIGPKKLEALVPLVVAGG